MKTLFVSACLLLSTQAIAQDAERQPAQDARGTPVVSNPAEAPQGANQPVPQGVAVQPAPDQQSVFAPRPSPGNYVPCTREVTDNCIQVHEKKARRRR